MTTNFKQTESEYGQAFKFFRCKVMFHVGDPVTLSASVEVVNVAMECSFGVFP
jgi:hypothetical protein